MQIAVRLAALATLGLLIGTLPGSAARDGNKATNTTGLEMLVFERQPCTYCELFRQEILPRYMGSPPAARAPMRFVNIDHVDLEALGLRTRLTTIPTAVLMQNGTEIDRITGYMVPETFFQVVQRLLSRAN
jgi:thioredoxin-related protein